MALNYLQVPPEDRPVLVERDRGGTMIEVECPVCGVFRPAIVLEPAPAERLAEIAPATWCCDAERSQWDREAQAEIEAQLPAPPKAMTGQQIWALFTIAERGRARRMAFATWPEGHALAGQLIDPDMQVQVLIDSLLARATPLPLNDPLFTQGVALIAGLGLFDGATAEDKAARAARVLAGLPPI